MPTTAPRRVLSTLAAAACAAAVSTVGAATAVADDGSAEQAPKTRLVLSITDISGYPNSSGAVQSQVTRVTLTCDPDGGSHPDPAGACDSLRAVGGYFERLPDVPGPCPLYWDPVKVAATGTWGDRTVSYEEIFGNSCEADLGTDGVFSF